MAALLILGGLLLIVLGLFWLIVLAFQTSLLWGVGSFLPPILLLFIVRCWKNARKAVVFIALGFIPLIVGITQLASIDSNRAEALLSLSWLQGTDDAQSKVQISLAGEIYGQSFKPHYGELIDGVLVLREGNDFFAQRELRIALPSSMVGKNLQALRLDVLPQDAGLLPDIEIMWMLPEQDLPEARRISRGYTLHLDLQKQLPNFFVGDFHLVLPPHFKTSMSGEVQLVTDRLHYIENEVDRHYDAISTLEYVLEDYLQRRFATENVVVEPFEVPAVFSPPFTMAVTAYVLGQQRTVSVRMLKNSEHGWHVEGDQYPQYVALPNKASEVVEGQPDLAETSKVIRTVDRRLRFSLQRLLVNPVQYQNLQVHVQTTRGNQVTGRFVGLDAEGALIINRDVKAPGTVSFTFLPSEIGQITLLEP
ncbi:MAG TPA: MFS transporter [Gammaproteobacteria bacterium]|nr:MFS transporter [Gammaproteobacteria bacterium]